MRLLQDTTNGAEVMLLCRLQVYAQRRSAAAQEKAWPASGRGHVLHLQSKVASIVVPGSLSCDRGRSGLRVPAVQCGHVAGR